MRVSKKQFLFCWAMALCLIAPNPAIAATRTAYFDQIGSASSTNGFSANAQAKCVILLNNPSLYDQTVDLNIYAYSSGVAAGNAGAPAGWTAAPGAAGASPATITGVSIPAAGATQYEFTYPSYPTPTTGQQVLYCRGSIVATDTNASQPGFLVANAYFITFSEASSMQTAGVTSASTSFKGNAVYSQIPISINRGKPF